MIKKHYRKLYRRWLGRPLSKDEFRYVVKELLVIGKGDSVLVHCSFGNLKPSFSPAEAVEILMEAVGPQGNLLMPYYPEDSIRWLQEGKIFDVRSTPTRSGLLSATFSKYPDVRKSLHPIKSLAVWGKDRDYLISTHHESVTPYDYKSPYFRLSQCKNSKAVGLGVFKNVMVHCAEDIIDAYPKYYHEKMYTAACVDYDKKKIRIKTYVHSRTSRLPPCEYLYQTNCPNYAEYFYRSRRFYTSRCSSIIEHIKMLCNKDLTAEKLSFKQNYIRKILSRINRI